MLSIDLRDLPVEGFDGFAHDPQQSNRILDTRYATLHQGFVRGGHHRQPDLHDALLDQFLVATILLCEELAENLGRGLLECRQSRPTQQQGSHHGTGRLVEPSQDLRVDLFEPANQALGFGGVLIHQLAALFGEKLQLTGFRRVRLEAAEFFRVEEQQLQDETTIAGIALGARGIEGLSVVRYRVRVDREEHQVDIFAEHGDQRAACLLQTYGDGTAGKAQCQLRRPSLNGLWGIVELAALPFAIRGSHRPKVFSIGPVDADVCYEFCFRCWLFRFGHGLEL
jgi:hypothetical protein